MNNQITKKQHIVPQFYLKKFANEDGYLLISDKKKKKYYPKKPKDIFCQDFFYACKTGTLDNQSQSVEDFLTKKESKLAPKILKIEEKIIENNSLDEDDKRIMTELITLFFLRGLAARSFFQK